MDLSVVVPTHNGSARLPDTLRHVAAQRAPAGLDWEVVLVDNGSTDGTARAAQEAWPAVAPAPLRVVREPRLGLGHAHTRGFAEARGRIVTWVEDDNWLAPDFLAAAVRVMEEHPECGACGGFNEPLCEIDPPDWFEWQQGAYACGPQGQPGDVTTSRGYVWGAGLTVRSEAWSGLVEKGFRLVLPDRQGSASFNSGGDGEICYALGLAGWRVRFEPALRLRHFLLAHRLDWGYLRRLYRGFGASSVGFDRFLPAQPLDGRRRAWLDEARKLAAELAREPRGVWESSRRPREGEADVLDFERRRGRLAELLRQRGAYDDGIRAVETARWRR